MVKVTFTGSTVIMSHCIVQKLGVCPLDYFWTVGLWSSVESVQLIIQELDLNILRGSGTLTHLMAVTTAGRSYSFQLSQRRWYGHPGYKDVWLVDSPHFLLLNICKCLHNIGGGSNKLSNGLSFCLKYYMYMYICRVIHMHSQTQDTCISLTWTQIMRYSNISMKACTPPVFPHF